LQIYVIVVLLFDIIEDILKYMYVLLLVLFISLIKIKVFVS